MERRMIWSLIGVIAVGFFVMRRVSQPSPQQAAADPKLWIKPSEYSIPASKLQLDRPVATGYTPLHMAVQSGDAAKVKSLLDDGADTEARDVNGWTPLFTASTLINQESIVAMLVERGAQVNPVDKFGDTPLSFATKHGYKKTIAVLQKHGATLERKDANPRE